MTTQTTRRSLVTSAAALPALAVPAFASEAIGPNNPDAELLQLGAELEAVIVDWHAQQAIDRNLSAAAHEAMEAAGLPDIDFQPGEEYRAYQDRRAAVADPIYRAGTEIDEHGVTVAWSDIHDRQFPLIDAIMEHKAQTLAGFAVQVRAVSLSHEELWSAGHAEGEHLLPFIEAACAFAGVVPVPTDTVQS